jgi:hypothetical protein
VRKYDVIYSAAFLTVAAFAFFLFYRDMNATLTKGNEAPIATVTEKTNDVERHFAARLMWDKLRNQTPIYNGDIIRTTNDASVDIVFTGDDELEVGPASLIQVRWAPASGVQADVSSGTVKGISKSSKALILNVGKKKITVKAGASVKAEVKKDGDVRVIVTKGQAAVVNSSYGKKETVKEGEQVSVSNTRITAPAPSPPPQPAPRTKTAPIPEQQQPATPAPVPIPKNIATPTGLRPTSGYRLDNRVLERSRSLTLSWNRVAEANAYSLILWTRSPDRPLLVKTGIKTTNWKINNLFSLLNIGSEAPSTNIVVHWQVSAERRTDTGSLLKSGNSAKSSFVVAITVPKRTRITRIRTESSRASNL